MTQPLPFQRKQSNTINIESHFSPFYCDLIFAEILSQYFNKTSNFISELSNFKKKN